MDQLEQLTAALRRDCPAVELREWEPMARHTTFRIGGPVRLMALPKTAEEAEQVLRLAVTKEEMGFVIGRTSLAIAAITDASLALALVDTLEKPDPQVRQVLADKALKAHKHRQEAKAHQRNLRRGKKK